MTNHISKFLSLILRHKPETINISLDRYGWANITDIVSGMQATGKKVDYLDIIQIVLDDSKGRYVLKNNDTMIRATQGHSISIDLELEAENPPSTLFHGTSTQFITSIMSTGLNKGQRHHVHLSTNKEIALQVGARRGKPALLEIDAKAMYNDGLDFFQSENGVWLTDFIDKKYITNKENVHV